MITFLRIVTLCGLIAAVCGLAYVKLRPPAAAIDSTAAPAAEPWPVGGFSFTSSTGDKLSSSDCRGHICVFACFFTCCSETCPQISGAMARLQGELDSVSNLRLISLTVDPERDTPEALQKYGAKFGADPARWVFLTGPRGDVEAFVIKQLRQGLSEDPGAETGRRFIHSNKLTLVDREGNIRGSFDGTDPDEVGKMIAIIKGL